jgi:hypothetical protein
MSLVEQRHTGTFVHHRQSYVVNEGPVTGAHMARDGLHD